MNSSLVRSRIQVVVTFVAATALAFGLALIPGVSNAQQGLVVGKFAVAPKVEVKENYSDNIFRTQTEEEDDYVTVVNPTVSLRSGFKRHALNFNAGLLGTIHANNGEDTRLGGNVGTDARLDITGSTQAFAAGSYFLGHEARGSRDNRSGNEALQYTVKTGRAGVSQRLGWLSARAEASFNQYDYGSVGRDGTTELNNDDRDRDELSPSLRLGFALTKKLELYTVASYVDYDYDLLTNGSGFKRNSTAIIGMVGVGYGDPGKISADIQIGVVRRRFDEANFGDIDKPRVSGHVEFLPLNKLSINLNLSADLSETSNGTSSSLYVRSAGLFADYFLTRDLILRPEASFTKLDYQDIGQEEDLTSAGIGFAYGLTSRIYVGAKYMYNRRDSNSDGGDFQENFVQLRLGYKR